MPGAVDNRIIRMGFDNKQFEKNIAKSQKSLEDFKAEMNFEGTSRSMTAFSKMANALSFDKLADNIQRLTDKFTGLGDVGEYVVSRIRASLEGAARSVESFLKSISLEQIAVGQSKYDSLNKAVMTIVATGKHTEEEAYNVFERLMTYTGETSYSFSDMVGQISAFTAAGQDLWASEHAMEGIANASAKAGQGVSQATSAMQIFAKALGNGKLDLQQWQSLNLSAHFVTEEFRQTLMDTAVEMGTLTKKADKYYTAVGKGKKELVQVSNLETTLNKGWATSKVLMAALQKYYFEDIDKPNADWETFAGTAAKAAQRALSLTDALNAMKEAVSAGWLDSFRYMFGDLSEAMETFTNIANRAIEMLDAISDWRNGILSAWYKEGGRTSLVEIFLGDYGKSVETGTYGILDIIEDAGKVISDGFWDFIDIFHQAIDPGWLWDETPGSKEQWLGAQLAKITGAVRDFFTNIKLFFSEEIQVGNETKSRLEVIRDVIQGVAGILYFGYSIVKEVLGFFGEIAVQLQPSFDAISEFLGKLGNAIYGSAQDAEKGKTLHQFFEDLAEEFRPLTEGINEVIIALMDMFGVALDSDSKNGWSKSLIGTLGDILKTLAKIITKVGKPILKFMTTLFSALSDLFNGGFTKENIQKAAEKIGNAFKDMLRGLLDALPDSMKFIKDWVYDVFGLWEDDTKKSTGSLFDSIKENFKSKFNELNTFFSFEGSNSSIFSWITNSLGAEEASDELNKTSGLFGNVNLKSVVLAVLGVAAVGSILSLINKARLAVSNISDFFGELSESLKHGFRVKYDDYGTYMLKITESIALIVACVAVIGFMPVENLIKGVAVLGLVMVGLVLFNKSLKKTMASGSMGDQFAFAAQLLSMALAVSAIAIAVGILMLAMTPLSKDPTRMLTAVLGLGSVLALLAVFMRMLKVNKFESIKLEGILGFAFSIFLLSMALLPLCKLSFDQIIVGLFGVAGILGELGMMAMYVKKENLETVKLAGIIALAFSLLLIVMSVKSLANMRPEKMLQGLTGVAVVLALLVGVANFINKEKLNTIKMGGFMGLAGSLSGLVGALIPLAKLRFDQVLVGLGAFGGIIFILTRLAKFIKKNEVESIELAGIIGLSFSIAIIAVALLPIAKLQWHQALQGVIAIGVIIAEIAALAFFVKKKDLNSVQLAGVIGLAVAVGILALSIIPLAKLRFDQVLQAVIAIGIVLLELAGIANLLKSEKLNSVQLAGVLSLAVAASLLALAIVPLAQLRLDQALVGVGALGIILLELAGFAKLIQKQNLKSTNIGSVALLIGSIVAVALVLIPLSQIEFTNLASAVTGLAAVILMVGLFLAALNKMQIDFKSSVSALLMMTGIVAIVVAFAFALEKVKDVKWEVIAAFSIGLSAMMIAMAGAIKILGSIGIKGAAVGIVAMIIGLVAVLSVLAIFIPLIIKTSTSALADASGKLVLIGEMLSKFSNTMSTVDDGGISNAGKIFDDIKAIFEKLVNFKSGNINGFTTAMFDLGASLSVFGDLTGGMTSPEGSAWVTTLGYLIAFDPMLKDIDFYDAALNMAYLGAGISLFNEGADDTPNAASYGFLSDLAGMAGDLDTISKMDIEGFKTKIAGLGGAIAIYALGVKEANGIEIGSMPDVTGAVTIMRSLSETLVGEGGFQIPTDFPSEGELTDFGTELAALALALQKFASASSGFGEGTDKAQEALGFLEKLKTKLTIKNLLVTKVFDGVSLYDLGVFGLELTALGNSLSSFGKSCAGFPDTKEPFKALEFLVGLKDYLTAQAIEVSIFNFFTGAGITTTQLTEFGKQISELGKALGSFAASTSVIDASTGEMKPIDFTSATGALDSLVKLNENLPKIDGLAQLIHGRTEDFTTLGGEIVALGTALNTFAGSITAEGGGSIFDDTAVSTAITVTEDMVKLLKRIKKKFDKVGNSSSGVHLSITGREITLTKVGEDIGGFGKEIGSLATGVAEFKDVKTDEVERVLGIVQSCIDLLRKLKTKVTSMNTASSKWSVSWGKREFNLSDIGAQVGDFGDGIGQLAVGLAAFQPKEGGAEITQDAITNASGIIEKAVYWLADLNAWLPLLSGGTNMFVENAALFGTISLSDVGTQIGEFGEGLSSFGTGLSKFTAIGETEVTTAIGAVQSAYDLVFGLATQLPTVDGIKNTWDNFWYGRETQLKDIGTQIGLLGEGLGTFGNNVAGKFTNATEITNAMNVFSSVIDLMSGLAYQVSLNSDDNWAQIGDYEAIARGINTFLRELSRMTQDDLDYSIFVTIFDIMKYISSSMKSMEGEIDSGSIDVFGQMVDALTGLSGINSKVDFSYVGYHIDTGVAKGIRDNKSLVINAAVEMAVAAYVAAKAGLEENSPSKVMMGVGEFAAEGLANGLTEGTDLVSNAGETLASEAVAEAIAALSRIGEDAQPTITPTLDFSQVEADMANYSKTKRGLVLDTTAAAGAATRVVRAAESTSSGANQNEVDLSGIYSRMADLGTKITLLGTQIRNMRFVLDSGVLAGAVTDGVDKNIGTKMFYAGRRN